jgi:thiol-disulfide isomerase/thioredoxin
MRGGTKSWSGRCRRTKAARNGATRRIEASAGLATAGAWASSIARPKARKAASATWCEPCRGQHPLYEQVKQRFKDNPDVVFLSIDTDEDREPVRRFLEEEKWLDHVYFEDGLSRALRITYIPTTVIIEKGGQVFGRMNGYAPERFVELLTGRIRDALGQ